MNVLGECGTGADARVRSDAATLADDRTVYHRERFDTRHGANLSVPEHAIGADLGAVADFNLALEHAIDINAHVIPAAQTASHIDPRGVGERDSRFQQALRAPPLVNAL